MPLDLEARLCLRFCDQRGEKNDRRSLQFRIGLDLCRYFASVCLWHHYVEQDQIRPKILGTLTSISRVVLFQYQIAACPLEKDFDQAGDFPVVINDQDASLFFDRRLGDYIDLRLIEPINMRQRWILTNDVRGIHIESVRVFDDLHYTRYFQIYSVPHRPEHHSLSVDLLREHWQLNRRRSVSHTGEDQTALGSSKAIISSNFNAAVIGVETIQRSAVREIDM